MNSASPAPSTRQSPGWSIGPEDGAGRQTSGAPARDAGPSTQDSANAGGGGGEEEIRVDYQCSECNSDVRLNKGEHVRCKECGARILYKKRTKRMVQFECR